MRADTRKRTILAVVCGVIAGLGLARSNAGLVFILVFAMAATQAFLSLASP